MAETKKAPETLYTRLAYVQARLRAPKGQFNKFGGYSYRSAEDILEAVKPLLQDVELTLTLTDHVEVKENGWVYVVATAVVYDPTGFCISATAEAREPETRKGMDAAQVTGSSSSYARKYALNGLFAIDDGRDPDVTNDHGKAPAQPKAATPPKAKPEPPKQTARDYSLLKVQTERLGALHGRDVADEYRWIVQTFGNPKGMDDAAYTNLINLLASMEE